MNFTKSKVRNTSKNIFRDFSMFDINPLEVDGIAPKVVVSNYNQLYILKFGKYNPSKGTVVRDYISEYISCEIAKKLGYAIQNTELGYFNGQECVAIEHFGYTPITFKGLGYSSVNVEKLHTRDENYSLDMREIGDL